MTRTGTAHTEGANIVYDYVGDGPLLLFIAGGGGDGSRYAPLSNIGPGRLTMQHQNWISRAWTFVEKVDA